MSRGTELRASDFERAMRKQLRTLLRASGIARPTISTNGGSEATSSPSGELCGGVMSEGARERSEQIQCCRSRRVTTTSDFQCAMREQRTTMRRRNKLRRFSRTPEGSADNISGVLSCLRIGPLAVEKAACIINTRHSHVAPLRVARGVLATPAKRVPAT
jgi:hypothetical protein